MSHTSLNAGPAPAAPAPADRRPALHWPDHPNQRYYHHGRTSGLPAKPLAHCNTPDVRVYRHAPRGTAELAIRLGMDFVATANLCPTALRELASDLLDAALDIEQHPAADAQAALNNEALAL